MSNIQFEALLAFTFMSLACMNVTMHFFCAGVCLWQCA